MRWNPLSELSSLLALCWRRQAAVFGGNFAFVCLGVFLSLSAESLVAQQKTPNLFSGARYHARGVPPHELKSLADIDDFLLSLGSIANEPPRGEFESPSEYAARLADARSDTSFVIEFVPTLSSYSFELQGFPMSVQYELCSYSSGDESTEIVSVAVLASDYWFVPDKIWRRDYFSYSDLMLPGDVMVISGGTSHPGVYHHIVRMHPTDLAELVLHVPDVNEAKYIRQNESKLKCKIYIESSVGAKPCVVAGPLVENNVITLDVTCTVYTIRISRIVVQAGDRTYPVLSRSAAQAGDTLDGRHVYYRD